MSSPEGAPIDWKAFAEASKGGGFMELLAALPCERWGERNPANGYTLLHYACRGPNLKEVSALLQSGKVDVNVRSTQGWAAANCAAFWIQSRVLEMLCATETDMRTQTNAGYAPLDTVISFPDDDDGCARTLMANGVRLNTVVTSSVIAPELVEFERGVLRCRTAAVATIRVKRVGKLWRWDKFLLCEVAIAIWATRYSEEWQN